MRNYWLVAGLALTLTACGDPETTDRRGYTKAPLEDPGVLVRGEDESPMAALGRPDRPRPRDIEAPRQEEPGEAGEQQVDLAAGVTQEQFDEGNQLFSGQAGCQACHGPQGQGTQIGPDLTDDQWLHVSGPDPDEIAGVIRDGVPQPQEYAVPMPPMGGADLNDQQIEALAAYVASIAQR